jgi:hypothetical protein
MQEGHITLYVFSLVLWQAAASTLSFPEGKVSSLMRWKEHFIDRHHTLG